MHYNNICANNAFFLCCICANREDIIRKPEEQQQQYDDGPSGMAPEGVIESTWNEVALTFDDMNLKEALLRGIYAYGYERPSAIQQRAILPCIKERDVIAQAQSGKLVATTVYVYCKCCVSQGQTCVPCR